MCSNLTPLDSHFLIKCFPPLVVRAQFWLNSILSFSSSVDDWFNYSKENTGKYYVINLCFLLAKFHIHKQKFTGSKPLFSLFKIDLDKYVETIQNSANLKAMKTVSLYSSLVSA